MKKSMTSVTIGIKRLTKVLVRKAAQKERLQNSSARHPAFSLGLPTLLKNPSS
jgi:hypothetical protein